MGKLARLPIGAAGLVYGYARVSTAEQADSQHALTQQCERLKRAGTDELLIDVQSGRKDDRRNFQKLLRLAEGGHVREIVATRLDRLGRNVRAILELVDKLDDLGVALRLLDEKVDTSTASGRMYLTIRAAVDEQESRLLSERVSHGMKHRRLRGAAHPKPPFGYRMGADDRYVLNVTALCRIADHSEWTIEGIARWLIAEFLRTGRVRGTLKGCVEMFGFTPFTHIGFSGWLTSPALRGHIVYGDGTTYPDAHPAYLDADTARAAKLALERGKQLGGWGSAEGPRNRPLTGLVRCPLCSGGTYYRDQRTQRKMADGSTKTYRRESYHCSAAGREGSCSNTKSVTVECIEAAIEAALRAKAVELASMVSAGLGQPVEEPETVKALRAQLSALEAIPNPVGALQDAMGHLRRQIDNLLGAAAGERKEADLKAEQLHQAFADPDFWATITQEERRTVYRDLVRKILIAGGKVVAVELMI
ncbi:recombinase family protein [Gloeobacter violaceus]|uniref:Glr3886 protein n=1 Tax=Gloeobacter violaceus (strain ATCC 29082 / PCC 7421) TaxID=251221 RepID=Q7NEJ3_GLOVI|nr:recombinase family protein [Gloeobacter violaceus]BAC91827.1 glr3886 [Gloeobacter violaceus PCC 7421]